ncbi:hypothetical protein [Microcoleus sp. herbarium2]|uniref:hypothetical protein n=1 Tax=Microcoleus sp. herbarium2 TaxID=3055433 RepID=UPI002FD4BEFE
MYFILINWEHSFWQLFQQVRANNIGQFLDFSQRFIAGMLRAIGNINFFQVGSRRDCIDRPKAE